MNLTLKDLKRVIHFSDQQGQKEELMKSFLEKETLVQENTQFQGLLEMKVKSLLYEVNENRKSQMIFLVLELITLKTTFSKVLRFQYTVLMDNHLDFSQQIKIFLLQEHITLMTNWFYHQPLNSHLELVMKC